jgi:hypothetical protein
MYKIRQDLFANVSFSWNQTFHPRFTHEYAYEFSKPDVSRVVGCYLIPQHYPLGEAGWLRRPDSTKILEFW